MHDDARLGYSPDHHHRSPEVASVESVTLKDGTRVVTLSHQTPATVVWRYRIPIEDRPVLRIPKFARALSVGPSRDGRDELDLWLAVDPDQPEEDQPMIVVGTGHPLPSDTGQYVGTAPHADGQLIFHVFTVRS